MKKPIFVISLILVIAFALTACPKQNSLRDANKPSSETLIMLDEGVWPENEYTEGLSVPPGTVSWAVLDTTKGYCAISLIDLTDDEYNAYIELLKENGFFIIEEVSEEIEGQKYVSIGTILSNKNRALSISYIPNNLGIYISFVTEPDA